MKNFIACVLLISVAGCRADENCKPGRSYDTPTGDLVVTRCVDSTRTPTRKYISIQGLKILELNYLSDEDFDKTRSRWIFRGDAIRETGCPDRLYLIDLSMKPVKVIAFGVKKACNEFHWASWGEKRSVIALKNNVSFVYENGKITPPASGKKLWKTIEPPHAGPGLAEEDAIGFAEEVPLPKP
jgi:hypothetical protein